MSFIGSFVLTTFVSVQHPRQNFNNPSMEALRYLGKASYIELEMDPIVKRLEKRHVPKWAYTYGPIFYTGYNILKEKRVSYTWRF